MKGKRKWMRGGGEKKGEEGKMKKRREKEGGGRRGGGVEKGWRRGEKEGEIKEEV